MIGAGTVIGFLSGLLVGASSIGSGSLVTPLLLLFTSLPTGVAIGTSLALASGTKLFGYLAHRRMGNVHHQLGRWLILGAIPGSLLAALVLSAAGRTGLRVIPDRRWVGLLLVAMSVALLVAPRICGRPFSGGIPAPIPPARTRSSRLVALLLGAGVSLVVTLTSVGSGGLLILALILWQPALGAGESEDTGPAPLCSLVGTATFCGLAATLFGAAAHLALHNLDRALLAQLALGSVPGAVLGAWLTRRIPEPYYQPGIAGLNLLLGLRLAWGG